MATEIGKRPVINLADVSFSYNGHTVLRDVNMSVYEKDFLSVVGPNAGGKTTLLKLILGLLKPTRGRVTVFGEQPSRVRRRIGYMPQQASLDPLFPVSVRDVVLMGRMGSGMGLGPFRRKDKAAADGALKKVGLSEVKNRSFSDLSGGQRQRVLIARALASEPELLLLDEPTSNVDSVMETEFFEILKELNDSITLLLVTHDLGFVSCYVKSVACVNMRVIVHPTSEISGEMINEIYGADMRMVRHDHRCSEEGHEWLNS